ncbi:MAG TPA: calcium-binding protein [Jatrophihabitans sp.]|nr:calcium-binding protein [Jatrophihabitans sp.]
MKKRNRARAVLATCALTGSGLAGLALAAPAGATSAVFVHGQGVLTVFGDAGNDTIVVSRDAAGLLSVNGGSVDIHGTTATVANVDLVRVFGGAGDDAIALDEANGPLPRAELFGGIGTDRLTGSSSADRLDGGDGNDTLEGGRGDEVLLGGSGDDFVDGNQGADTAVLNDGNDVFQWDPGDGSDVVEGQAGADTMLFNGANIGETFNVSANGHRVLFTRDIGTISMDLNGIERVDTRALGGADAFTVHDLSGTDLTDVLVDEAGANGAADGAADRSTVLGTAGADVVTVTGTPAAGVTVTGLAATVRITGADPTLDALNIDAAAGDDVISASGLDAGVIGYSAHGGDGNDLLIGSAGDDALSGDAGDDILNGGPGQDVLDGGAGANVLIQ